MVLSNSQWWAATGEDSYSIEGSGLFESSKYIDRTPSSVTTDKLWTFSTWVKLTDLGADNTLISGWLAAASTPYCHIGINAADQLSLVTPGSTVALTTNKVFRDYGAWYHILVIYDSDSDAASDRIRFWVNGVQETSFSTENQPSSSANSMLISTSYPMQLGRNGFNAAMVYSHLYQTETALIEGTAYSASSFGEFDSNGVWVPIDITGLTFGTNGFLFASGTDIAAGTDSSGEGNNFAVGSAPTVFNDSPTDSGDYGNYATFNPLIQGSLCTLSNGNLTATGNSVSNNGSVAFTQYVEDGGLYYYEITMTTVVSEYPYPGVIEHPGEAWINTSGIATSSATLGGFHAQAGATNIKMNIRGVYTAAWGADPWANGDIVTIAIDDANGAVYLGSNASGSLVWQNSGDPTSGASKTGAVFGYTPGASTIAPYIAAYNGSVATINTGQTAFTYTPPTGYKSLGTVSRPAPSITKPSDHFLPIVYEGNGGGQRVGNFIPFTDAYAVDNSCVFDRGDSDYLSRTPGSASNRKTWTFSAWVKRGALGHTDDGILFCAGSGSAYTALGFNDTGDANEDEFYLEAQPAGGTSYGRETTFELRDASSWFNFVVCLDTTESVANDRIKIWINGVAQTLEDKYTGAPTLNLDLNINNNIEHRIGEYAQNTQYYDGYMADIVFIDGTALTPSSFGQTDTSTNRWIPKDPSGLTFGTNGFYLEFGTAADLGDDTSGETNDWAEQNIDADNQTIDTPTKNFATLDNNAPTSQTGSVTVSDGNRKVVGPSSAFFGVPSTMALPSSGKFYVEAQINGVGTSSKGGGIYVMTVGTELDVPTYTGGQEAVWGWHFQNNRHLVQDGSDTSAAIANGDGDIAQMAIDIDNQKVYMGINDTWYSAVNTTTTAPDNSGTATFSLDCSGMQIAANGYGSTGSVVMNFGATDFTHTPPTDFVALNQDNMAANTAGITGFSWIKNRDADDDHILQDRVRGVYKYIISNDTDIEATDTNSVQRFLQQGVQIGNMDAVNTSAESFVLWQWAANGTGTLNEEGDINSMVSANTAAGFSIATYTGNGSASQSFGHGLTQAPECVIIKYLNASQSWNVGHVSLTSWNYYLRLEDTHAESDSSDRFGSAPSATVVNIGDGSNVNYSSGKYVAYCWHPVEGYSKFGSYIGNGLADGTVIYTGFKPAFFITKKINSTGSWYLWDSTRMPYNPAGGSSYPLTPNGTTKESDVGAGGDIDFLADGFKLRTTWGDVNGSNTYIYIAFAENPFGGSGVAQAKAR